MVNVPKFPTYGLFAAWANDNNSISIASLLLAAIGVPSPYISPRCGTAAFISATQKTCCHADTSRSTEATCVNEMPLGGKLQKIVATSFMPVIHP
jgi:hypothetical protein